MSKLQLAFRKWLLLYLNIIPPMLYFGKVDSIRTVIQIVRRNPLVSVVSTLSSNSRHLHWPSQVYLQPLVMIIVSRGPGPNKPTSTRTMKSRQPRRMVRIPPRRGCNGGIFDSIVLKAKRTVAKSFWSKWTRQFPWGDTLLVHLCVK